MEQHVLIGKTITSIKIASDKKAVLFVTDCGEIKARADADCCSDTWIEHIELPVSFPAKVIDVKDVPMPDLGQPDDYDLIQYYGLKINTDKGDMLIDYRNSSNGYYGGDLVFGDDYFYGGVYGQNVSIEDWVSVERDV